MNRTLIIAFILSFFLSCNKTATINEIGFVDLDENNDFDWAVDEITDETVDETTEDLADEDIVDEDLVDEDLADEDIADEDIADEDLVDEDIADEDIVDEDIVDEDLVDEGLVDEDLVDEDLVDEDLSDEDVYIPGNIIFVKHDATGLNDGTSWTDAYTDLSAAIRPLFENKHVEGKEIWVVAGTYKPTDCPNLYGGCTFETPQRKHHFTLVQGVGIYGGFLGTETDISERDWENNETILSGDFNNDDELTGTSENAYHVFFHDGCERKDNSSVLDGFTITGGNADGDDWPDQEGGGIRNNKWPEFGSAHTTPIIRNCTFKNNSALLVGGAMYNHEGASPVIENCIFIDNQAETGGAIQSYQGSPSIKDSTFSGNIAVVGGAVGIDNSNVTIENSTFIDNNADLSGGAVYLKGAETASVIKNSLFNNNISVNGGAIVNSKVGSLTIESCYFYSNAATGASLPNGLGGAIQNQQSDTVIVNSAFMENVAFVGGAIANVNSNPSIINCSISENTADGAIVNGQSNPAISNTIIYGNSNGDLSNIPEGTLGLLKSIPEIDHSNIGGCGGSSVWVADCGNDNGNNFDTDPLFVDSGDHPLNLTDLSPCIDLGDNSKIPVGITKDIAGNERIQGTAVDMGAYEVK